MVLAEPFRGLRPQQWEPVDHLQPGSAGFALALDEAAADLDAQITSGRLTLDPAPSGTALWVDDRHQGRAHRTAGVLLAVRTDAVGADAVLPHEATFPEPVGRRVLTRNRLLVEPTPTLLLLRESVPELTMLVTQAIAAGPGVSREQQDGPIHHARRVEVSSELTEALAGIPALVCDGHHRIAAARSPGAAAQDSVLAWVVAAESAPRLHPVHRTVRSLPAQAQRLLSEAGFDQQPAPAQPDPGAPVLVTDDGAWALRAKPDSHAAFLLEQQHPAVRDLPASLVHVALQLVLGIGTRRDEMGTTIDPDDAVAAVAARQVDAAVLACGPSLDEVWRAADAGVLLPPKATWFAPKPFAGAVLRPLDAEEPT